VAYSIQAPGPHVPGYRLAVTPVSCRQLEADAGNVHFKLEVVVVASVLDDM